MCTAEYVWSPVAERRRLTHVFFKRSVRLTAAPRSATLHVFAHTIYHLRVNGVMLGYGPARSYPEYPEFDTYDLTPYLQAGDNLIALDVGHTGRATFHHLPVDGAMIAWGAIVAADGTEQSLATPGEWRCALSPAHAPDTPRCSFAIGPVQIFDERKCSALWDHAHETKQLKWETPIVLRQHAFGELRPRSIPHLTQDERSALMVLRACRCENNERLYSFLVMLDYDVNQHHPPAAVCVAYTYIYSPRAQRIEAGLWWGDNYLNGRKLTLRPDAAGRAGRSTAVLLLRKGWNYFSCRYQLVHGMWDMALALPNSSGTIVSATRDKRHAATFMVAGPVDPVMLPQLFNRRMDTPERWPEFTGKWRAFACDKEHVSPCKAITWQAHGAALPVPAAQVREITLPPGGAALVVDMGAMTLGRIFVDYTAPRDTVLNIGGAEDLAHGRPRFFKMVLMHNAERQIACGGRSRLESFEPRGARYLELVVSGNRGPVKIHAIGMISQVYPYERRGAFECSDPFFNQLWENGWNTLRLCSEDVITDTPWRERTLYGGDLLPEMATALVTSGDMRLSRRCVDIFLQSFVPALATIQSAAPKQLLTPGLADYPMIIVVICGWLCRLTGDRDMAARATPVFEVMFDRIMQSRRADGLFDTATEAFIDHHYQQRCGCLCAFNALLSAAFAAQACLLTLLGKTERAGEYADMATKLRTLISTLFWNARNGAFADVRQRGRRGREHSITANNFALLFGAPTPAQAHAAFNHYRRQAGLFDPHHEGRFMSAYGAFYGLGGLYAHGGEDVAELAMRTVYARMIEENTETIWEHAHPDKSMSHAWSTAPNFYLSTRALGVRLGFPETTGLDEIVLAPQAATLQWARGAVPHPLGVVEVDWRIQGDLLRLRYRAPAEVRVRIVPQGRLAALRLVAERC